MHTSKLGLRRIEWENRGEERDISATQGGERGDRVNTLKEAFTGVHYCLTVIARSIQHILDFMFVHRG